jgi:chemotaxis protein methyltransferase CheR
LAYSAADGHRFYAQCPHFDSAMKKTILEKVRRVLQPDGYLFLGAAETTLHLSEGFERIQLEKAGCYRART